MTATNIEDFSHTRTVRKLRLRAKTSTFTPPGLREKWV